MSYSLCSATSGLLLLFLLSAVPIAYIISLELATPSTHVFYYHSSGFLRECARWDDLNRRFIISLVDNGLGEIRVPDGNQSSVGVLEEVTLVKDVDLAGNASLGIIFDRPRNRLLVAIADVFGNRYSALAAYDLSTWKRLFLTQLSGPSDTKALADDVAVDPEGNAYITNVVGSQIWKVGKDGELLTSIKSPLFIKEQWYKNYAGLNGIIYHPGGFLLVIHTFCGDLFKIDLSKDEEVVKLVKVNRGSLTFGDGLLLLSPSKLVVAGNPSGRLVESSDGWESASVVGTFKGPAHRLASAATLKDGKVYLNHLIGMGYPKKKHAIVEAVFSN